MIDPNDLRIDSYDPMPAGGIKVGYPRGLSVTHIPSGIRVQISYSRSQHAARELLISMIEDALTHPLYKRVQV